MEDTEADVKGKETKQIEMLSFCISVYEAG